MAKTLLTISFILVWLSSAAFTLGNISFSPALTSVTQLFGPFKWQVQSRSIIINNKLPEFIIYGYADTGGGIEPVVTKADFLEWANSLSEEGRKKMGDLFATGLPRRPFVSQWGVDHDAGFRINIFSARVNLMFFFWGLLTIALPVIFCFWLNTDINYVISPKERWLKDEEFKRRVRELEIDFKDNPSGLRTRTFLLALLGYGFIWGVIALIAAIGIGLALTLNAFTQWGYISIVAALPLFWFVLRLSKSLLMARGGDSGVRLRRHDAPMLFALLDKIKTKGKGPEFARVFVDMEINASVSRHTGFLGSFGFGPVTLTLGLPLMQALSVNQLAGVIGHEYGHVAAKDNALSHWIYRIRNGWLDMGKRLKTEPVWYTLQLNAFYQWFIGIFNAYSFTLSRQCEYEADAFAAGIVDSKNIADALVAIEVRAGYIHKGFWDKIWQGAESSPMPFGNPYQKMGKVFKIFVSSAETLEELKKQQTSYNSTHPALPDRTQALKREIKLPEQITESAASRLLGDAFEEQLAFVFDQAWERHSLKKWKRKYSEHNEALAVLNKFKTSDLAGLRREDLMEMVSAAHVIGDDRRVMDICWEILKRDPANAAAEVNLLGYRLLNDNDESALLQLDELVNLHPEHIATASRFAFKYLQSQKRHKEAEVYKFRLDDWAYKNSAAEEERQHIYSTDILLHHGISSEYVKDIRKVLESNKNVKSAWMVRKEIDYFKENPFFIIALQQSLFSLKDRRKISRDIKRAMTKAGFPSFFRYFWVEDVRGLKAKLKKEQGSLIYKK